MECILLQISFVTKQYYTGSPRARRSRFRLFAENILWLILPSVDEMRVSVSLDPFDYATACDTPPADSPYQYILHRHMYLFQLLRHLLLVSGEVPSYKQNHLFDLWTGTGRFPNADLENVVMCNIFTEGVMTVTHGGQWHVRLFLRE